MDYLFPDLLPFYPDENTLEINKYFSGCQVANCESSFVTNEVKNVVFLCFTNRSGSNYIAQSIASSGLLNIAQEVFNYNRVISVSKKNAICSYLDYINYVLSETCLVDTLFKVSAGQLIGLYNCGLFSSGIINAKFIHVYREDVLAQAVSLYIANKTKLWTSEQGIVLTDEVLPFEPDLLLTMAHRLMCHNATFDFVFKMLGVAPLKVSYEQFVTKPVKWVADIGHFIDIDGLSFHRENVKIKKQSNSINSEMVSKLHERFRLR